MLFRFSIIISWVLCFSCVAYAQNPQQNPQQNPPTLNFKKTTGGIEYAFIIDKPGGKKPQEGEGIHLHLASVAGNRYLYNSYLQNKGKPVEFTVAKPAFKGDIIEAIMLMTPGDSLVCLVDADLVYKNSKQKKPDFIKKGEKVQYFIRLVSIKSKEQVQKEQQALFQKQMNEQLAQQKKEEEKRTPLEEKELKAYFTKNHLTPQKTSNGLYYTIKESGVGEQPTTNDTVSLNYRGQLLDGTIFDSNIDSAFNHVTPFEFPLGLGRVIKGWDEGVALLNKGTKATFYIPSRLAYGASAMPGNNNNPKGIPAHSILIFDVELLNIKKLNKQ